MQVWSTEAGFQVLIDVIKGGTLQRRHSPVYIYTPAIMSPSPGKVTDRRGPMPCFNAERSTASNPKLSTKSLQVDTWCVFVFPVRQLHHLVSLGPLGTWGQVGAGAGWPQASRLLLVLQARGKEGFASIHGQHSGVNLASCTTLTRRYTLLDLRLPSVKWRPSQLVSKRCFQPLYLN